MQARVTRTENRQGQTATEGLDRLQPRVLVQWRQEQAKAVWTWVSEEILVPELKMVVWVPEPKCCPRARVLGRPLPVFQPLLKLRMPRVD